MIDDLNEIIKSDLKSHEKFKQFKINFWEKREKKRKGERRRARIISVVLSSCALISIVLGFYAINAEAEADHYKGDVDRIEI